MAGMNLQFARRSRIWGRGVDGQTWNRGCDKPRSRYGIAMIGLALLSFVSGLSTMDSNLQYIARVRAKATRCYNLSVFSWSFLRRWSPAVYGSLGVCTALVYRKRGIDARRSRRRNPYATN